MVAAAVLFVVFAIMIILSIYFEAIEGHLNTIKRYLREAAEAIKNLREQPESSESDGNENESE